MPPRPSFPHTGPGMYRLVFQSGRYQGKRLVVRQNLTLVGHAADCHLTLPDDDLLAPRHARFEVRGTGVYLASLDPDRAVERNGAPVRDVVRLVHGDRLVLGRTAVVFQDPVSAPERLRTSPGLLQPVAVAVAAAIVGFELLLLAFLVDWPARLIRPETEARDIARAEALRAERAAELNAETGGVAQAAAPAVAVNLPGTAPVAATNPAAPANAAAPASPIVQMLDEAAAFEPAQTNASLADLPPVSGADPAIATAQRLLAEAVAAAQFADSATAFRLLDQIHHDAPGFLPAHVERARLLEARGDLDAAQQRWSQILGLAPPDSPFHALATQQRQRLAALQDLQTHVLNSADGLDLATLPRHVRLLPATVQKTPPDADIAEMRILNGALELAPDERLFQDAVLQVFVTFYDADTNGHVQVSRAITTPSPFILRNAFADRPRVEFDATYVVPRGFREQELRDTGRRLEFHGYTLHVFAGRILQDAVARPKKLLDLPIHFPGPGD